MIERVDCVHAARCAGCPLIGLSYREQLDQKSESARAAFADYPILGAISIEPIAGADPITEYRVRAKLVVGPDGAVGLYASGGHEVVDIPECRVLRPSIARVVGVLRRRLSGQSHGLVSVDLREGANERVLVTLVTDREFRRAKCTPVIERETKEHRALAEALMNDAPEVAGVVLGVRVHPSRLLAGKTTLVRGVAEIPDSVGQIVHFATSGAFVQAHRGQAAWLHERLRVELERELGSLAEKRVLDVYGGSGAIGLSLARAGARVTVVESYPEAAEAARRAGLDAITASADMLATKRVPADAVVVNPPRRGLEAEVRSAIAALEPAVIAYVSCLPQTLARDLADFVRLGFAPRFVQPFDMIPLSDQVETLAILVRAPSPPPRMIERFGDFVAIEKPPHEPPAAFVARVRALEGLDGAVPMHGFERDLSGACLFRVRPAALPHAAPKLFFLVLARGVTRESGVINRDGMRTRYRRRAVIGGHSLLEVETSAKQALRRHLAALGHPLVGDERHGHSPTNRHFFEKHGLDRCFLHLARVAPKEMQKEFESSLPGDLVSVIRVLG